MLGEASRVSAERAEALGNEAGRSHGRWGEGWGTWGMLDVGRRHSGAKRANAARDKAGRERGRGVVCESLVQRIGYAIIGRRSLLAVSDLLGRCWSCWIVGDRRKLLRGRRGY
jgi:hypothetical protein